MIDETEPIGQPGAEVSQSELCQRPAGKPDTGLWGCLEELPNHNLVFLLQGRAEKFGNINQVRLGTLMKNNQAGRMPIAVYGCQNLGPGYRHDALVVIVDCFIAAHQFIVTDHAGNVFHTLKSIAPTVDNIALGQVDLLVVQFIPQDGLVFLGEDLGDSEDMFGIDAGNYHRSVSAQKAGDRFHLD